MRNPCEAVRNLITTKPVEECSRFERAKVDHHVKHCSTCRDWVLSKIDKITCDKCHSLIEKWHLSQASQREQDQATQHLRACLSCQEHLAKLTSEEA